MLAAIHDRQTGQRLACERQFLATLDGSCETPIAGLALLDGNDIWMRGEILRPDGSGVIRDEVRGPIEDGTELGRELAERLKSRAPSGFFSWLGE